jgi:hypothetical protein
VQNASGVNKKVKTTMKVSYSLGCSLFQLPPPEIHYLDSKVNSLVKREVAHTGTDVIYIWYHPSILSEQQLYAEKSTHPEQKVNRMNSVSDLPQ